MRRREDNQQEAPLIAVFDGERCTGNCARERERSLGRDSKYLLPFFLPIVIIVMTSGELLRQILLEAHGLGMSNGEFAFVSMELVKSKSSSAESSWYRPGDRRNKDAREMFESLLQIAVRVPTSSQYSNYVHDVVKRSHAEFGETVTDIDVSVQGRVDLPVPGLLSILLVSPSISEHESDVGLCLTLAFSDRPVPLHL